LKILIDIGHPAHVHYFRNFIKIMEQNGHEFFITARDKEVTHNLLKIYNINYKTRGKGKNSLIGKLIYILKADYIIYKYARKFKPDLFLSFASPYAAQVSKILRKPHITFDDTEHASMSHKLYTPFTDTILNPSCFYKQYSKKQIFFKSYMELCYLHTNYFTPKDTIYEELGIEKNQKYVIIRFVSWNANHDIGQKGLSYITKIELIKALKDKVKIFISSENELPNELEDYRLKIQPDKLHDALAFATLYIGEGSTTASECAVLGTPAILINSLTVGYCKEQNDIYRLCYYFLNENGIIEKALEILNNYNKEEYIKRKEFMLSQKIDPTKFMIWFIENYPKSIDMKFEDVVNSYKHNT
jgi:predicted glycosyltransferase